MTNLHTPDAVLYHDLAAHYAAAQTQIRLLRERAERAERRLRLRVGENLWLHLLSFLAGVSVGVFFGGVFA